MVRSKTSVFDPLSKDRRFLPFIVRSFYFVRIRLRLSQDVRIFFTQRDERMVELNQVTIYTDGGSLGNPGPGGWGAVLKYGEHRKELSGGFRHTTNNRMEITAAIEGLKALKEPCKVKVYSDSQYLVNAIMKGWAEKWQANRWMRNKKEKALNPDLWEVLLELCDEHEVEFIWVKGHAGIPENERCDVMSKSAASRNDLPADTVYERECGK